MSKGKKRSGARPGRPQPLRGTKGKRKGARLWYVEIGRASCRERVWSAGISVPRKRKPGHRAGEPRSLGAAAAFLAAPESPDGNRSSGAAAGLCQYRQPAAGASHGAAERTLLFSSSRRHTRAVSAFLLNRSSDLRGTKGKRKGARLWYV